jgi:hypothetical protein
LQWIKASKPCFKKRELKHQFQMGKALPAPSDKAYGDERRGQVEIDDLQLIVKLFLIE